MKKFKIEKTILSIITGLFLFSNPALAQRLETNSDFFKFNRKELNWGIRYSGSTSREELRTSETREFEELTSGNVSFQFVNRHWIFQEMRQEEFAFNFEAGPLWGNGNWIDSTAVQNIEADHQIYGIQAQANLNYANRFYFDKKNYTLVEIGAWGSYQFHHKKSDGISMDSNFVKSVYEKSENQDKFRCGLQAKAGWGIGRLNPMNHYMVAEYLLKKYYPGRNFSEAEIVQFATELGNIKNRRDYKTARKTEKETELFKNFLKQKLLLVVPNNLEEDWEKGEFLPRFNGSRAEIGPFFNYYNREPDFIYGGYFQFENAKYINLKWNWNFNIGLDYNRYKEQDWMLGEVDMGWSFFPNLSNQWDFGLKYVPGMVVNRFEEVEPVVHNFIPYLGYFAQVNSKMRVKANVSLRINDDDQFMVPGPEFSLAVYWSRY